jgi:N-acetylneuraminate synthase
MTDGVEPIVIGRRAVGPGHPTYIVAELSANHQQHFEHAVRTIEAAHRAGADAVKLQTYTADTLTIDSLQPWFRIQEGTWAGRTLYDLYREASTPWEWHRDLQDAARELGLDFFSTPFDETAVDFLLELDVPAFKVASFELVDLPLLKRLAATRKPVIASTGMATPREIAQALEALDGAAGVALLKCTSAYPAPPESLNLRMIPELSRRFAVPVGLSDHTLGSVAASAATALGASIIEKHLTLSRAAGGPDASFSAEPDEFAEMVRHVRATERMLGAIAYGPTAAEQNNVLFRRSLFVVRDMKAGEPFTRDTVRSIRPGQGLPVRFLEVILTRVATADIARGTPLDWTLVSGSPPTDREPS